MKEVEQKLEELKSCIGKTDKESRQKFEELTAYFESNDSEEVKQTLTELLDNGLAETEQEINTLKQQMEEVYDILPLSYIAKHYFKKSRAWLYQRLNGYPVKGKVYSLNEEEKKIFNAAIQDLAKRIGSVHLS